MDSHAWHLAWRGRPLVTEQFQAWANGPVCRELFATHRGRYVIEAGAFGAGNPEALGPDQKQVIDDVLQAYLPLTGAQLSELTHAETPWAAARTGLPARARSERVITDAAMQDFYGSLNEDDADVEAVEDSSWPDHPRAL
jgi:uncharacterized phage-associated protein